MHESCLKRRAPIQEAITSGDAHILREILLAARNEMTNKFETRIPKLISQLKGVCAERLQATIHWSIVLMLGCWWWWLID
jgi:hypothetical protein